jgi:hypothetical protein
MGVCTTGVVLVLLTWMAHVAESPRDLLVWAAVIGVGLAVAVYWYNEAERADFERIDAATAGAGYGSGGGGGGGGQGRWSGVDGAGGGDGGDGAAATSPTLHKKPPRVYAMGREFARARDGASDTHSEGNIFITDTEL